jgi:hypothetical protein
MNSQDERSAPRSSKTRGSGQRNGTTNAGKRPAGFQNDVDAVVGEVTDALQTGTEAATAATKDIAGVAADAISSAARAVASQASELVGNVAGQLGSSVEEQKDRGADSLVAFAHAIKTAAAELDQQSPGIARQFRGASERVERFSDTLRDRRVEDLVTDYSNLAKTQPIAFFAGAMIAGFALSRFIKSSAAGGRPHSSGQRPSGSDAGA